MLFLPICRFLMQEKLHVTKWGRYCDIFLYIIIISLILFIVMSGLGQPVATAFISRIFKFLSHLRHFESIQSHPASQVLFAFYSFHFYKASYLRSLVLSLYVFSLAQTYEAIPQSMRSDASLFSQDCLLSKQSLTITFSRHDKTSWPVFTLFYSSWFMWVFDAFECLSNECCMSIWCMSVNHLCTSLWRMS